jgi:predicted GNAT family N-acyltransferase
MAYIGPARTWTEVEAARAVAATAFGHEQLHKEFLWSDPCAADLNLTLVQVLESGRIAGVLRVLPRTLWRMSQRYSCAVISSVCIAEDLRGQGYGNALVEAAIHHATAQGHDLACLFARRAADNFYTRFDFWGLGSYSRVSISSRPLITHPIKNISIREVTNDDIHVLMKCYENEYACSFGRLSRSEDYWKFTIQRLRTLGVKISVVEFDAQRCGYVMHKNSEIYELAFNKLITPIEMLGALCSLGGDLPLVLHVEKSHRVVPALESVDVTISQRQCSYGGHMIRVLRHERVLEMLRERVLRHASENKLLPKIESYDGLHLAWDGVRCSAMALPREQAGLGHALTARLLGCGRVSAGVRSVLDPESAFEVGLADQI